MSQKIIFAASILSADFAQLGRECENIIAAGADVIHFDVMDHHFVPNLTFGAHICSALRNYGITTEIDVHLMVTDPEKYIAPFAKAGANRLTFHPITVDDPITLCKKIHDAGMQAGLAYNPDTAINISAELLSEIDLILIMSVFAGFGGQPFIPESVEKIRVAKNLIGKYNSATLVGIDGGVNLNNIESVTNAGANFIVMGSALFEADNYVTRINQLRQAIAE